jgi:metallo-beta-lactamase class B
MLVAREFHMPYLPKKLVALLSLAIVAPLLAQELPEALPKLLPDDLFRRNIGTPDMLDKQFPPHQIIDNIYYIGTESLGSFLITTEAGHILVNTDFERNVATLQDSVEKLGFKFTDVKIIIGSHEHADHMEGDALAKQLTGAKVVVMAEQVPGLTAMTPGDKPHPLDQIIHDGEQVTLGNEVLTAHLTPGHSAGCTSWELSVNEAGKDYKVVIICSVGVNPNYHLFNNPTNPTIVDQYRYSYAKLRTLAAEVPLGSHPAMYRMAEKYPLIGQVTNPFIDPAGYEYEIAINEQAMNLRLEAQRGAVP